MFQNKVADHIAQSAVFGGGILFPGANPQARLLASNARYSNYTSRLSATPTANQWLGAAVVVADPNQLGSMILSYDVSFSVNAATVLDCFPFVLDRQSPTPFAVPANVGFAAAADHAWFLPPYQQWSGNAGMSFSGRMLVDTRITSATVGITVREFLVGFTFQMPAGTFNVTMGISARLYTADFDFFQPSK